MAFSRERTRRDVPWLVPSWTDPVARGATGLLGGPTGRYAAVGARGPAGVAAVLVLLGTLNLALAVWSKGHCLMKGWSTPDQFWRACYSDLPVVHVSSPLAQGLLPWAAGPDASPSTQPPLSGLVMWLIAQVSPGTDVAHQQLTLVLWAVLCVPLLGAGLLAVVALQPRRPWQGAQLALSPVLTLLVLVSTDLLGVTLTLLAVWAWRRERSWVAGLLLGLAVLVRPYPLLVLAAMVLLAWRHRQRLRALQVLVAAVLGALAVLVPLVAVEPRALTGLQAWWSQGAGYGALQMIPSLLGAPVPAQVTVWVAATGWVLALGLGAWLVRRPGRRYDVVRLSALMLLVVVLTAGSVSVQSGLWVLPFLALSVRPWWEHLVWAGVEALHFLATWLHIAFASDAGRGLPPEAYALVVLLRAGAWGWLLWRVFAETPRDRRPLPTSTPTARRTPSIPAP